MTESFQTKWGIENVGQVDSIGGKKCDIGVIALQIVCVTFILAMFAPRFACCRKAYLRAAHLSLVRCVLFASVIVASGIAYRTAVAK